MAARAWNPLRTWAYHFLTVSGPAPETVRLARSQPQPDVADDGVQVRRTPNLGEDGHGLGKLVGGLGLAQFTGFDDLADLCAKVRTE